MDGKCLLTWTSLMLMVAVVEWTHGQVLDVDLPSQIMECVQLLAANSNISDVNYPSFTEQIHSTCLQQFLWKFGDIEWQNFGITEGDKRFVNSLIGSLMYQTRNRRQAAAGRLHPYPDQVQRGPQWPKTGFKVRREYRRLTDAERKIFHDTLLKMKASGQYDTFANLHSGVNVNSAHNGPNFPGWHRVYLSLFEEAMRQISPSVTLPYWDSTLDFDMQEPINSIIWSTPFLGNGDGLVTTGPFANWTNNFFQLMRNIGGFSTLFSKEIIERLLTKCRNSEILTPTADPDFDFEFYHGGPHVWVGGQMSFLNSAAHDPVFFMHHAFVDYIWELFRARQARSCGVNPETDYPETSNNLHLSERIMDGFPGYRNIDGYRNYWTQFWYRYESSPTCSTYRPFCGSPYLRCDLQRQRCVSVERPSISLAPGSPDRQSSMAAETINIQTNLQRAREQEVSLRAGPKFRAPPSESRTADARARFAASRQKRQVAGDFDVRMLDQLADVFGASFRAPPHDARTAAAMGLRILPNTMTTNQGFIDPALAEGRAFQMAEPMPLIPLPIMPDTTVSSGVPQKQHFRRTTAGPKWSYVPVGIVFTNNKLTSVDHRHPNKGSRRCEQDKLSYVQVRPEATLIDYRGTYTTYLNMDKQQAIISGISYIKVALPTTPTKVALSVTHSCGKVCKAYCIVPFSNPQRYESCAGTVTISPENTNMYGLVTTEMMTSTWPGDFTTTEKLKNVGVYFRCSNTDTRPWEF